MNINPDVSHWFRKINLYWVAALGVPWLLFAGWQSARTLSWTPVVGRVTQYQKVRTGTTSLTRRRRSTFGRRRGYGRYQYEIGYNYHVDGRAYSGDAIWPLLSGESAQLTFGGSFARGDSVPVYFNPKQPDEAVLIRSPAPDNLFAVAWVIGFAVVGHLRRKRDSDRLLGEAKARAQRARAAKTPA